MSHIADIFWHHLHPSEHLADYRRFLELFSDCEFSAEARAVLFDTPLREDEPDSDGLLGNFMPAVLELSKLAKAGDAEAAFLMGQVAVKGIAGFPRDLTSGATWWRQACEFGHSEGCLKFALAQFFGKGLERDPQAAQDRLRALAEAGDGAAARTLGEICLREPLPLRDVAAARRLLERGRALGDARAVVELATSFLAKDVPGRDPVQALALLNEAAGQGHPEAAAVLGHLLVDGPDGWPRDVQAGIRWLEQAYAAPGNSHRRGVAAFQLGRALLLGEGLACDGAEALRWLERSAREGDEVACLMLSKLFEQGGFDIIRNPSEAFKWLLRAARLGSVEACHKVGEYCLNGFGVSQSATCAVRWIRHAAQQGHAFAQGHLAYLHWTQKGGLDRDEAAIYKWARLAALQKDPGGLWLLGECLMRGVGTAVDEAGALEWLRKAAEAGHTAAQSRLARMYYFGIVVAVDYAEAGKWASQAAENDDAEAQCVLGEMFVFGQGVEQDYQAGAQWLRAAAERELPRAQGLYGVLCAEGVGLAANWIEALRWLKPAAWAGDERARDYLKGFEIAWDEADAPDDAGREDEPDNVVPLRPPKFPRERFVGVWRGEGATLQLHADGRWRMDPEGGDATTRLSGVWQLWGDQFRMRLDACVLPMSEADIRRFNQPQTVLHIDASE